MVQLFTAAWASYYSTVAKALAVKTPKEISDTVLGLLNLRGEAFQNQCDLIECATEGWNSTANLDPKTSLRQKNLFDFIRCVKGFERNYFLSEFLAKNLGSDDQNLISYARPEHLDYLFRESVDRVCSSERVRLAVSDNATLALTHCGASRSGLSVESLKRLDAQALNGFSASELLALVDYTHLHTKTFGFVNSCVRHHDRLPQVFLDAAAPVEKALRRGLSKLEQMPEFLYEGALYRGLELPSCRNSLSTAKGCDRRGYSYAKLNVDDIPIFQCL